MNERSKLAFIFERMAGAIAVGGCHHCTNQDYLEADREQLQNARGRNGTAGGSLGSRFPTQNPMRQGRWKGERIMKLLKTLFHLWKGDLVEQEIKQNRDSLSEVRQAISETKRAMLDGLDDELFIRQDGWAPRNTHDDK